MTLSDLLNSDVSSVIFNTSDFATTVTRWPGGRKQDAASVTAIVLIGSIARATDDEEDMHDAELQVASSQTLDEKDAWLIAGERYDVDRIGKAEYGIIPVYLMRHERVFTSGSSGRTVL